MRRTGTGGARSVDVWRGTDDFGIALAVEAGNTHTVLTEEETQGFRDALDPVVDRWIEEVTASGIDGAALVDKARALVAENTGGM